MKIEGKNAVSELLKSGKDVDVLLVEKGTEHPIIAMARERGVKIQFVDRYILDKESMTGKHQGFIARVSGFEYCGLEKAVGARFYPLRQYAGATCGIHADHQYDESAQLLADKSRERGTDAFRAEPARIPGEIGYRLPLFEPCDLRQQSVADTQCALFFARERKGLYVCHPSLPRGRRDGGRIFYGNGNRV